MRDEDAHVMVRELSDRVAGGIAGLRDGADSIPVRWRTALRGTEIVEPLIDALIRRL